MVNCVHLEIGLDVGHVGVVEQPLDGSLRKRGGDGRDQVVGVLNVGACLTEQRLFRRSGRVIKTDKYRYLFARSALAVGRAGGQGHQ